MRLSGSQSALNSRKASHQLRAEHLGQQSRARLAVAVLAAESEPPKLQHQIGGAVNELAELAQALPRCGSRS